MSQIINLLMAFTVTLRRSRHFARASKGDGPGRFILRGPRKRAATSG
jgi:hypothetical protein